ncbi:tyrosine--tRNA ligase [Flaviflexus ciconiae]|uniref:Tyrosine--tRNA ligase n=1 Tax=Flaviflexus ciconiae TaxID=2496867 RepID=A0A3Q9G364_9ACTO|nr:tyrosine--tRNA ligase [Flaviflexus ciconiae]AZQ76643.1 tyrosine--tRNA ligase [Flaviflexus ciconiae]
MSHILDELQARGLIAQHTDIEALRATLDEGPITYYCGFDPTAASLHHGHLVQAILMRHLQYAGHNPLVLVGGATGMIGDPRDSGERTLNPEEQVAEWTQKLANQLSGFLSFEGENAARIVNNYDWTSEITAIDLLRNIGRYFRLGTMIAKDTVARRLASDEGISYTEFSYQILQANDFLELYRRYGCILQTGGNDQWGNLVGGMDLIHKAEGASVHVMTTPIITKSDGTKFGKTEGGAIWLDPTMMSPYAFYQFWLNQADADIERLLKVFTFIPLEEIDQIVAESLEKPYLRLGQRRLADEVTTFVHGAEATDRVKEASAALFGKVDPSGLDGDTLQDAVAELVSAPAEVGMSVVDLVEALGLEKGKGAARRTITAGGLSINSVKVEDPEATITDDQVLPGGIILVRKGKKNLAVGRLS